MAQSGKPEQPKDPLDDIRAFDSDAYGDLDLDRLTAYGVRVLIECDLPVTFENVVVVLYRMFPDKFGLTGFPVYPDAARVNRAILHCFPKYRNYLTGRATTGYRLTHLGEVAVDEAAETLAGEKRHTKRRRTAARSVADNFMREVITSKAFGAFTAGDRELIELYDISRILHAAPNADRALLQRNMKQLIDYAEETGRKDVLEFLQWAQLQFPELRN